MKKPIIDDIDRKILNILQENAAITNVDLSKEVGLTPGPTLVRVQNLIKRNVISGYSVRANPTSLGYKTGFVVFASILKDYTEEFEKYAVSLPHVAEVVQLQSENMAIKKYVLTMFSKSEDISSETLSRAWRTMYGIVDVEVLQKMKVLKQFKLA